MINEQITKYLELKKQYDNIKKEMDFIKNNLKIDMQRLNIDYYIDESTGNDIKIRSQSRKSLNRKLVEKRMNEEDFKECFITSEFIMVDIRSKERREHTKHFINKTGIEELRK